ncbi:hypothetical protein Tco_1029289 [Tanacetum coccineum]|uniref:Uncharacterized protein n=1 Tax=Tanacetum coccineum TaxID=301880 RepID=A0ABQ5G306_9ASTR
MPTGKIGVYTRFFEFANFRLPLSTFLVDVLRDEFAFFYPYCRSYEGRVVPLLPVAPARASSELEASVDKLFEEGRSGSHAETFTPPKKLREDHGISTGSSVAGKSKSALQRLLAGVVLNSEVGVVALPTLPFISSSVSVTPEQEDGGQTDFMVEDNLQTITAPPRFVISSDSSHHSGANIAEAEVDSFARPSASLITMTTIVTSTVDPTTTAKEKFIKSSIFDGDSSSGAEHTVGGFSGLTGSDFIVGGIRTVVSPDTDLQKMVDEFSPPKFFASIRGMEHDELFMEFNVGAAR